METFFFHYYSNPFNKASPMLLRGSTGMLWVKFNFVGKVNKRISSKSYSFVLWEITFQWLTLLEKVLDRLGNHCRDSFGPWNHFLYFEKYVIGYFIIKQICTGKGKNSKLKHHVSKWARLTSAEISHVDIMYSWYDDMMQRGHIISVVFSYKNS